MEGLPEALALMALAILIYLMKKDKKRRVRRRMVEDEFGTLQNWAIIAAIKKDKDHWNAPPEVK